MGACRRRSRRRCPRARADSRSWGGPARRRFRRSRSRRRRSRLRVGPYRQTISSPSRCRVTATTRFPIGRSLRRPPSYVAATGCGGRRFWPRRQPRCPGCRPGEGDVGRLRARAVELRSLVVGRVVWPCVRSEPVVVLADEVAESLDHALAASGCRRSDRTRAGRHIVSGCQALAEPGWS